MRTQTNNVQNKLIISFSKYVTQCIFIQENHEKIDVCIKIYFISIFSELHLHYFYVHRTSDLSHHKQKLS